MVEFLVRVLKQLVTPTSQSKLKLFLWMVQSVHCQLRLDYSEEFILPSTPLEQASFVRSALHTIGLVAKLTWKIGLKLKSKMTAALKKISMVDTASSAAVAATIELVAT